MEATRNNNIASVAWSDHVIFGESDGRLDTVPALRKRMNSWKADLGAQIIHWRCTRDGKDIWVEDFDLSHWQDLKWAALTLFLTEMRESLKRNDHMLAVGAPRGHILGPPLGNTSLQWEIWVKEGIVDHLIIDQNSSRCPSMWHDLWPMHRGYGYIQNYLNEYNMNSLEGARATLLLLAADLLFFYLCCLVIQMDPNPSNDVPSFISPYTFTFSLVGRLKSISLIISSRSFRRKTVRYFPCTGN
jgi:hypothetical protein